MRDLTPEYLAGLFDGEGCVSQHEANTTGCRYLTVNVANQYKPLLDQIMLQFPIGGGVYNNGGKNWLWNAGTADNMFVFLTVISPHVVIKRDEVAIALAITQIVGEGGRLTDQQLLLRERLFDLLEKAHERRINWQEEVSNHVAEIRNDSSRLSA